MRFDRVMKIYALPRLRVPIRFGGGAPLRTDLRSSSPGERRRCG